MTARPHADGDGQWDWHTRVERILVDIELAEIEMPHIVLCRNVHNGDVSYSGPYPSALAALTAADHERAVERRAGGAGELSFHVAPLYPAYTPPAALRGVSA